MFILVAQLNHSDFFVHDTVSNKCQFFESDPTSFLYFLEGAGHEIDLDENVSFSSKIQFDEFVKGYLDNKVNKQLLKNNFKFIETFLKKNSTPMFADSNFVFALSEKESLELIIWKNKVKTITYINRDNISEHVRIDLDENNDIGFYSPEKEPIFIKIVEALKNL